MRCALVWFRNDLRLTDQPALQAALRAADTVIPVYVHSPEEEAPWAPGAASHAWLHRSLRSLAAALQEAGSGLVVRRGGSAAEVLCALARETGAGAVFWSRRVEPACRRQEARVAERLRGTDVQARVQSGNLLLDPDALLSGQGSPYRVFTPFWRRAGVDLETLPAASPAPRRIPSPPLPASDSIDALALKPTPRWDRPFWSQWQPGEAGAQQALSEFIDDGLDDYDESRNRPDLPGTSRLSPHLHFGEISVRSVWEQLAARKDTPGRQTWRRELGWREFCQYLLHHFPHCADADLNDQMQHFDWAEVDAAQLDAWRHGRTGVPIVDAGMRELWQCGWMHNRVRMIVASFLTKHLRHHWLHGARWFWDTLVDADLASNSQGWQWTAGTGADAAPYFRVFNPVLQSRRFDPHGHYLRRWLPELAGMPDRGIHAPWEQPLLLRQLAPAYPAQPVVDLAAGRAAALEAYRLRNDAA
jgi:deoxyribodipyrimidine photo-lyase